MFNFTMTYDADSQTIIARNAHLRGEDFATIEAEAKSGRVTSLKNIGPADLGRLLDAGILVPSLNPYGPYKLAKLSDGSPEAEAVRWGRVVQNHFCTCATEPEDWQRYEVHDGNGEYTGAHGFACPTCFGILQTG